MIQHAAELSATILVCYLLGCLLGSLLNRTIGLTGAARIQSHMTHGIDRAIRILEWRILPWRNRAPVPLPRVVSVPPPDYRHAEVVEPLPLPLESPPATIAPSLDVPSSEPPALREAMQRADQAGVRPTALAGPRQGSPDDLAAIKGLGKRHAARLASIGIYHFSQLAAWTPQEVAWVSAFLDVGETIRHKDWVGQATRVAGSDDPESASRPAKKPPRPRSKRGRAKKAAASEEGGA